MTKSEFLEVPFNEIKEGFTALESAREGKITLRQHVVEKKPAPTITQEELLLTHIKVVSWNHAMSLIHSNPTISPKK